MTGRLWPPATRITGLTWRRRGSGWGKTTPFFLPSTACCQSVEAAVSSAASSRRSSAAATNAATLPKKARIYVAAIDIAGEAENGEGAVLRATNPKQDSTVVTIGELDFSACDVIYRSSRGLKSSSITAGRAGSTASFTRSWWIYWAMPGSAAI